MSDHVFYDAEFFSDHERPKPLRKQVGEWIDRYCATTGKSYSIAWRKAYLALEEMCGFRVPEWKGLDAVQKSGLMEQLLDVVRKMSGTSGDEATEVNNAIPDFVSYESDRSKWKTKGIHSCSHEWGVFSTMLEDVALLVQCVECGAYGKVTDPTQEEWRQAFHAPSHPYCWQHGDRVALLPGRQDDEAKRHIRRTPGKA